jgi:ubiquitin C-terminal hydrolase
MNERLNKFDCTIKFNFNNIEQKLEEKPYINDLKKIIDNSNSIIGELFFGLMLETYKCNNCNKEFEKINKFKTIDIEYRKIINELYQKGNSFTFIDMNNFLDFIFLEKRLNDKKEIMMEKCSSCKNKSEISKRKILEYPSYLIIRLKIGDFVEKEGFVNMNEEISSLMIKFKEIKNMEYYASDSIKMNKANILYTIKIS